MEFVLAALQWDPHIRGGLILLTAILILCGSVYLLLATNSGPRLGFLLALAGLAGWMTLMGVVWMVFGIGMTGRDPSWEPQELVIGSLADRATVEAASDFPNGWEKLPETSPIRADASAAADRVLAPSAGGEGGHGNEGGGLSPEQQLRFQTNFRNSSQYQVIDVFRKGGENKNIFWHTPHYTAVQVKPVVPDCRANQQSTTDNPCRAPLPEGSAPRPPLVNENAPVTTLVMVRDLGNVRLPPFLIALFSLIVFGVTCSALHERDKEIMRARGQIPATA